MLMAKIALIVSSVGHDRQAIKVVRLMQEKSYLFIDPIEINLPMADRMYKEMTNPQKT
jgi:hypothetical protein